MAFWSHLAFGPIGRRLGLSRRVALQRVELEPCLPYDELQSLHSDTDGQLCTLERVVYEVLAAQDMVSV